MLPSEELLEKYRAAEKSGATEPEQTKTETEPTEKKEEVTSAEPETDPKPATSGDDEGQGTTKKTDVPAKDDRTRLQRDFEKRLNRQERSHQAQMAALRKEFDDYKKSHETAKPELKLEDFKNAKDYEDYKTNQLKESIKAELEEENRQAEEKRAAEAEQDEKAQKKLRDTFSTDEAIKEFQDVMNDFVEDESDFLQSDKGQLFQEFIDVSPLGLLVAKMIAQSPKAVAEIKKWSKEMMMDQLHRFENDLKSKIEASKAKVKETAQAPAPAKQATPTMPSTGAIGKTSASTGFSAKDWLRQKYPERYGRN